MQTISYQVSASPTYEGWDAPQSPGTFSFEFKSVVECHRHAVREALPYVHMRSRGKGEYQQYLQEVEALAWLERRWLMYYQHDGDETVPWPDHLAPLSCGSLILGKNFVSVVCPACAVRYIPDQVTVKAFKFGKALFAHGGRGVLCPRGHGLYVILEWNS
jgi:hypothetical protein